MKKFKFDCYKEEDKIVELMDGKEYRIPGNYPTSLLIATENYAKELETDGIKGFKSIIKAIYPLFQKYNTKLTENKLLEITSPSMIPALLSVITDGIDPAETKAKIDQAVEQGQKKNTAK